MTVITTEDGTQIYYKDWGSGAPSLTLPRVLTGDMASTTFSGKGSGPAK